MIENGAEAGDLPNKHIMMLGEALQGHQMHVQRKEMQQQQMVAQGSGMAQPGQGATADNSAAPAIAAGQVPLLGGR